MPYTKNINLHDNINRFGETFDLPLFSQEKEVPVIQHPNWLWSGTGIKVEVYAKMKERFAENAFIYLEALITLGGHATDHEVKEFLNDSEKWPLHIVSARRNDLTKAPFYLVTSYPGKKVLGPKGMPNIIWFINYKNLFKLTLE